MLEALNCVLEEEIRGFNMNLQKMDLASVALHHVTADAIYSC